MDKKRLTEKQKLKLEIKILANDIRDIEKRMLLASIDEMIKMNHRLNNLKLKHKALCQHLNPPKYRGFNYPDITIINY